MIKVIGIGNRVMGDDGIALYVLKTIENKIKMIDPEIEVIIGEIDFLYCLNKINDNDFIIIVDSTYLDLESGKVTLFSLKDSKKYSKSPATQHESSFIDMIENDKYGVSGYIIGIEVFNVDFSLYISDCLKLQFEDICSAVFNKIKIALNRRIKCMKCL
ncbi:hydrogenase maturation protease [Marinisporobacter balticus]|uniref:Hydrogenase maturation protease n=1 Tax=Marinisporobacter balticus TaxID=2018667 RepID=A0A4R2KU43_9FIRM|nr:hydrogenase maturation protease [Marinisporobacter balticus]TCO74629.1 hydrogenase maturation protease [Marinisporobacter balticus]